MTRKYTKTVTCLSMSAVLFFSSLITGSPNTAEAARDKKIIMNKTALTMKTGETFQLKVKKAKPAKPGKAVKFRSEKKQVATVDKQGVVKAKNKGKTNIVVTSKKDKSLRVKVAVKVRDDKSKGGVSANTPPAPVQSNAPAPAFTPSPEPGVVSAPPAPTPIVDEGRVFNSISEMYADIISEQFKSMMPQNNGDIIALDLKDCSSLSDTDKQSFADIVSSKYGETVIKTKEELVSEGKIVNDGVAGFLFKGGVLITVKENKSASTDFSFDITCMQSGLSGVFFKECKAMQKDGGWKYELGMKGLS